MSNHLDGEILAGDRIGSYNLNMTESELLQKLTFPYKKEERNGIITVYHTMNMSFYIDTKTKKLEQICVFNEYNGKFLNKYGIGSDLLDIDPLINHWFDDDSGCYYSKSHPNILFQLNEKLESWKLERNTPNTVGAICIGLNFEEDDEEKNCEDEV